VGICFGFTVDWMKKIKIKEQNFSLRMYKPKMFFIIFLTGKQATRRN